MTERELIAMMAATIMSGDPNEMTADEAVTEALRILLDLDARPLDPIALRESLNK